MDLKSKLYRVVLERAKGKNSLSVASIHVLAWRHEERLHCFSSLLSALSKIRSGSSETILRKMIDTKQSDNLAHLDVIILNALLESKPLRLKIPTHENSIFNIMSSIMSSSLSNAWKDWRKRMDGASQWSRRVSELAHHVEALLSLTKHETDEMRVEWMSIRLKQLAVDELLLSSQNNKYNLMVDISELVENVLSASSIRKHVYVVFERLVRGYYSLNIFQSFDPFMFQLRQKNITRISCRKEKSLEKKSTLECGLDCDEHSNTNARTQIPEQDRQASIS